MKLAFLYAGHGSQKVGMGRDLYEAYPAFRTVWDDAAVDFDLKTLCWEGPEETLSQTRYTQPCMVAFAAGITAVLREEGIVPSLAAGLSLGEYSALHAAGVWDAAQAVSLASFRGRAMEEAVRDRSCGMVAVLGLSREALADICRRASSLGVAEIANYNCPGQLVIGGDAAAVEEASRLAREAGARRTVPLKVSGPFHTSLMAPAGEALRERFREVHFNAPAFPVVHNATARPAQQGEEIDQLLIRQVQSPVYFEDSLRYLEDQGVDTAVEIGPGRALSAFVKKTAPGIRVWAVEDVPSLTAAVAALKGEAS